MQPAASSERPPQPPDIAPRLRLSVAQRIGIPLIALIPVLALLRVFGESRATWVDQRGPLLATAHGPARLRYRQRMTLDVSVANRSSATVNDVRVRIDSSYLDRFTGVSLSPHASPDGWVYFGSLPPAASVQLTVALQGDRTGAIRGAAVVTDAQGDTARLPLKSTVFP
ncbi:MAG TPA: hypothetical protein VGG78_08810 [Gemmatimonadaceae bacterium]